MKQQRRNSAANQRLQRLNRRQRKKHRLGEFRELGFSLAWQFHKPEDENFVDNFLDAFIEVVEARDLCFGGGFDSIGGDGFVCRLKRGSATEADRFALVDWLSRHPAVATVQAGVFRDAWHDWGGDVE